MDINREGMVSFGYYECEQVRPVVAWLREQSEEKLYLWGRSMGAVTALLYQSKYSGIDGLVLDSPFHSLHEIFVSQFVLLTKLPKVLGEGVMLVASRTFKSLLRFSMSELDILELLAIDCPAFIIANPKDALAGPSSTLIYNKCRGERKILYS
jgi:pimeloyl-ACP methyl ester carboxylesterase